MTTNGFGEETPIEHWDAMEALHRQILLLNDRINILVESREDMAKLVMKTDEDFAILNVKYQDLRKVVVAQHEEIERLKLRDQLKARW